ncbi:unnamed protein product, partial [Pleuronectes platessa]
RREKMGTPLNRNKAHRGFSSHEVGLAVASKTNGIQKCGLTSEGVGLARKSTPQQHAHWFREERQLNRSWGGGGRGWRRGWRGGGGPAWDEEMRIHREAERWPPGKEKKKKDTSTEHPERKRFIKGTLTKQLILKFDETRSLNAYVGRAGPREMSTDQRSASWTQDGEQDPANCGTVPNLAVSFVHPAQARPTTRLWDLPVMALSIFIATVYNTNIPRGPQFLSARADRRQQPRGTKCSPMVLQIAPKRNPFTGLSVSHGNARPPRCHLPAREQVDLAEARRRPHLSHSHRRLTHANANTHAGANSANLRCFK